MPDFGIYSPKLGVRDDQPSILLDPSFIGKDSRNVHEIRGVYKHLPGRLPTLADDDGVQIATPKYIYAITAVDQGADTFTISGNHASNFTGLSNVRVNGSTGNDKLYTLSSAVNSGGNTVVTVSEDIPDATVDGSLFVDVTPVLKYHTHRRDATSIDYLLLATAYHIFQWDYTNKQLDLKFTCTTPANVSHWSIDSLNDQVYATNNDDLVQVYNIGGSPSNSFADLDSGSGLDIGSGAYVTKAKYLRAYEGYLLVAGTTEAGTFYPRRVRGSDASDTTTWEPTASNDAFVRDMHQTPGHIVGMSQVGPVLVVAKTDHVILGRLNTTETVFDWDANSVKHGVMAEDVLVPVRNELYFLGSDCLVRELTTENPVIPQSDFTLRNINKIAATSAKGFYIEEFNQVWFALPSGDSSSNDLVVAYDIDNGKAHYHDIPIVAFGRYEQEETYTYDTLPYDTYDEWGVGWLGQYDTPANESGTPLDIAGDSTGETFELNRSNLDDSSAFTATLDIHTSLSRTPMLHMFKRCSDTIELTFKSSSTGTVTLSAFLDGSTTAQSLGSQSLSNTGFDTATLVFRSDLRFKHAVFRITSTAMFEFIGMMFYNFELDGVN